ncbi:hypothetical protein ES702_00380 [subsurface metagenome]
MNILILGAGTMRHGGFVHYKPYLQDWKRYGENWQRSPLLRGSKCNIKLLKETIGQRMVRMFKEQGLTDITVAYSFDKPKIEGVSFRKVEYVRGRLSTVYQCRDLISDTLIASGDLVFSEQALKEILEQEYDEILWAMEMMVLVKPKGAELLKSYFKENTWEFKFSTHWHKFECRHFFVTLFHREEYFKGHVKFFVGSHFAGDVDHPGRLKKFRDLVKLMNKGNEPKWRNGYQKGLGIIKSFPPVKMWWECR